jgi:glucose/arabinose dehydrogenase
MRGGPLLYLPPPVLLESKSLYEDGMRRIVLPHLPLIALFCSLTAACSHAQGSQVSLVQAFPNLSFNSPVGIVNAGDGSNRLFVVEQAGTIRTFDGVASATAATTFLDIQGRVVSGGEMGLLGLAFHPDFKNNGYFYVDYTAPNPRHTVISRFTVNPSNPAVADPASEKVLLTIYQPYENHNGGQIAFGPDGYLYIGMGDGGSGGDPGNRAQNLDSILGKILRIDVDHESGGNGYAIPADNPFVGSGHREEIYSYGMRNPWRFSFDPVTGKLWCGDVGQGKWEEIDLIDKGKNYGWHLREGFHCYDSVNLGCGTPEMVSPIWEYGHTASLVSIIGGFVYRGSTAAPLVGKYVYADLDGSIFALAYDGESSQNTLLLDSKRYLTSFGTDENRELYVCSSDGRIYKFAVTADVAESGAGRDVELARNEPNPFSGTTTISYSISRGAEVRLTVYDLLGRAVATLVDGLRQPGSYRATFDGSRLPSGLYYLQLATDGILRTSRQMILMR